MGGRPGSPVKGELPALREVSLADAELAVRNGQIDQTAASSIVVPPFDWPQCAGEWPSSPSELFWSITHCCAWYGHKLESRSPGKVRRYLEHSHVAHAIRFGDLLRVEFMVLTAWLRSAEWARKYRSLYELLPAGDGWQMVRQGIEEADRRSLSPVRFLCEGYEGDFAPAQVAYDSDIRWFDHFSPAAGLDISTDIVTPTNADEARYAKVLLTIQQEEIVNASLRDVFLKD
jgi:hypothetical protein